MTYIALCQYFVGYVLVLGSKILLLVLNPKVLILVLAISVLETSLATDDVY